MNGVDSIQAEFSRDQLSQSVSLCLEWCCPHPHGIARFCRAFMRLDQFPSVVISWLEPVHPFATSTLILPSSIRTVTASS